MDVSSGKLRVLEIARAARAEAVAPAPSDRALQGPHHPAEFAQQLYDCEAYCHRQRDPAQDWAAEPYSLQWFLDIENRRLSCRGRWIPRLLEFAKHRGETLLGIGNGLGTDWVQYARNGARVIVCCPSSAQLTLIRRNFELRGMDGRFVHATPTTLPLESASIDVACLSSLLHAVDHPTSVIAEVYRVLKPGGKVLAVTPARFDIAFWYRTVFFWQRWLPQKITPPTRPREGASFTGRALRRLFGQFVEHRIYKRQLRRSEVPHIWRWMPMSLLERTMGRALIVKAFKPLSAATCAPVA